MFSLRVGGEGSGWARAVDRYDVHVATGVDLGSNRGICTLARILSCSHAGAWDIGSHGGHHIVHISALIAFCWINLVGDCCLGIWV